MALVLKDRVKEATTTSGTGTVVLNGAATGYQSFAVIGNANTTYYTIAGGSDWEVGIGTYYSGNTSLSRDTILASSNANAAVTLSGSYDVFVTYPAEEAVYELGGNVYANGSSNVSFVSINVSNNASFNNVTITNGTISAVPNAATDIVNKTYVDGLVASGIHFHQPVRLESPTALVAVYNQPNGAGNGVGATLTNSGTQVTLSVDGVATANTNRILVYNQANAVQNGVYVVSDIGSNATNWILTRSTDTNTYGLTSPNTLGEGSTFFVQEGNTGAGETYTCNTPGTITFGTTNITFTQISSAQIYSAGTGLSLNNTTFSISNTAVTAGTYGDAGNVATITVNAQGQLTNAVNTAIVVPSSSVTGLGTMALQNATTVAITGGSINGTRIGNATPSNGAFTTISASGVVSGVGFANYLNAPPTIGGVTANTGAFTSLSASGTLTASANLVVTQRTGYLFANNSSPVTASTTIPNTAITGLGTMSTQNANAVAITGGTINNVSLSNITYGGLGTMATQNANAVAIAGGAINGTVIGDTGTSTGAFTTLQATTLQSTTLNNTNTITVLDTNFTLQDEVDSTKQARFQLSGLGTNNTVVYTLPAGSANASTLIDSSTTQTINGTKTFNSLTQNIGANTGNTTVNIAYGATLATNFKNINIGTGGVTGARANVTIGQANTTVNTTVFGGLILSNATNVGQIQFPDGTTQATAATPGALAAGNSSIIINNVNITANATIAAGQNGFSVGPIVTANGVTVTIASGQTWTVI